jgi:ABC-type sugar transport system ATPase subunit
LSVAVADLRKAHEGTPALEGVTLSAQAGEVLAVVGPSGAGKSTLLRCVAGLDAPDGGRVEIGGRDVTALAPPQRSVAMVFQGYALFPHLDVEQNIGFGLRARGGEKAGIAARVREVAGALGLEALLGRRPAQLSGGERQRVALARALAGRPAALLLDEPLSNLDAPLRARARGELRRLLHAAGPAVLHVTHDQHEALTLGDRVAVLEGGRLLQLGPPDEVYERPASLAVARFLGSPAMNLLPADGPFPAEGAATVGVRPEHIRVGEGAEAVVEEVERGGHDVVWWVRLDGHRLAVRPGSGAGAPSAGERVRVAADPRALRRFDAEGRAVG